LQDLYVLLFLLCLSFLISLVFFILSFILGTYKKTINDPEKLSAYECGFDPFEDSRNYFEIRFYVIALLFIVFDLEMIILLPWAISLGYLNFTGFFVGFSFFFILVIGFIYEWYKGSLEWE
jgi:NADH-quinone oxidoreductase subunit A